MMSEELFFLSFINNNISIVLIEYTNFERLACDLSMNRVKSNQMSYMKTKKTPTILTLGNQNKSLKYLASASPISKLRKHVRTMC